MSSLVANKHGVRKGLSPLKSVKSVGDTAVLARLLPLISPPSRPQGFWAMVSGQLQVLLFIHTSRLESNSRPVVRPKPDGSNEEL